VIPALDTHITNHAMGPIPRKISITANITRQRLANV
jgi:hypothetical protein